jgi:hypothetical protein
MASQQRQRREKALAANAEMKMAMSKAWRRLAAMK